MADWPIIVDISNYDYDADRQSHEDWVQEFKDAGVSGFIVGSQWPAESESQLQALLAGGLSILGTYAEPDAQSAIDLARQYNCNYVGLACERGSIISHEELAADIQLVHNSGLTPWLYGNAGDLLQIASNFLTSELVWLANYGTNDPQSPREPITEYTFPFYGVVKLIAHQYSSTIRIAKRERDHSYYYGETDLTPEQVQAIVDKTIADKLYNSQLIDSSQIPELVAQILGVHDDTFTDPAQRAINSAIRAKLFPPPGEGQPSTSATAAPIITSSSTFTGWAN